MHAAAGANAEQNSDGRCPDGYAERVSSSSLLFALYA
jgi:hypothetical protein